MTLDEYKQLKKKFDDLQRQLDRGQGALEQLKSRMKKELKVNSIDEAETLFRELETKQIKLERKITKEKGDWESKWKSDLGEL